jgi:hypothetical protein
MKITLEINDTKKAGLLIEFLKSLNYVDVKSPKAKEALPDWHIAVLQQRLKDFKKNPDNVIDFNKAISQIESEL